LIVQGQISVHAFQFAVLLFKFLEPLELIAVRATVFLITIVKGSPFNPKVTANRLYLLARFILIQRLYDQRFSKSDCFDRPEA
jgi:hypothetical protein